MFAALVLAAAQPVIVQRMEASDALLQAEIVERPAGTSLRDAVAALAGEAGASGWRRIQREFEGPSFRYRVVGFRSPDASQGVFIYARPGEVVARAGRLCRLSVRDPAGMEQEDELRRVSDFCIRGIAPLPVVTIEPLAPRPPPQR